MRLLFACQPWLQIRRKVIRLKSFTRGILVGIGLGFLFAPMKGEELRRILAERAREFRDSLPESSRARLDEYTHRISSQVAYARENWRDYAQQAASKMKETGATLGTRAMQTGQDLTVKMQNRQDLTGNVVDKARHASQDMAQKARHAGQDLAYKAKQTAGLRSHDGASTRVIPESDLNY